MKISRIIAVAFAFILLAVSLSFNAFALNVDGALLEAEWKSADETVLVSSTDNANCDISYGIVYVFCDESASRIYIGFKAKLTEKIDENSAFGAAFSADSDEFIYVTTKGVSGYDTDKYDVEAEACSYSDSVYSAEVALGIKYGMSSVDSLRVRFVDASGSPSNIYTVNIPDANLLDDNNVTKPVYNNSDIADAPAEKTTKVRTTKPKTTKHKPTKPKKTQTDITRTQAADTGNIQGAIKPTANPYNEETTVLTVSEVKLYKNINYTVVCVLIVTALGICVAVNLSRDKEMSKKEKELKRDKDKDDKSF